MINRDDMLELTRRMNQSRASFTRLAGGYMDVDGFVDGTFNINFRNLTPAEQTKNIAIAKAIPFAETNVKLKAHPIPPKNSNILHLLEGMKSCGLKNDALMNTFYEIIADHYEASSDYAIYVFHDRYDIPVKGSDKERLGESEEVYEYLICAICPLVGEYEPGEPEYGFLYPNFEDRSCDDSQIAIFHKTETSSNAKLDHLLLNR